MRDHDPRPTWEDSRNGYMSELHLNSHLSAYIWNYPNAASSQKPQSEGSWYGKIFYYGGMFAATDNYPTMEEAKAAVKLVAIKEIKELSKELAMFENV